MSRQWALRCLLLNTVFPFTNVLGALAGVGGCLIALRPSPAWLAVAHWSLEAIGLAYAVHAVDLLAGLAARYHARLHLCLGEVLELIVDV